MGTTQKVERIEADVWHALLYMWGMRLWSTFASSNEDIELSSRTNICLYVRVLVLTCIALAAYISTATYIGATLIYYPSIYFGWDYWITVGQAALGVVAIFFALFCLGAVGSGWSTFKKWWKKKSHTTEKLEKVMEGTNDRPSIVTIAKNYVEAKSDGFCTSIEIVAPVATSYAMRHRDIGGFELYVPIEDSSETSKLVLVDYIKTTRIEILPVWWKLIFISIVTSFFLLIFSLIHDITSEIDVVWEGECSVKNWEKYGEGKLLLNLTCNGVETSVTDRDTLFTYLNDHVNPRCFSDKEGTMYCTERDKKRMKKVGSQ